MAETIRIEDDRPVSAEGGAVLPVLVVDLDGTLIRSDLLYETFWSALSRRWWNVVPVLGALRRGRAALKRELVELGPVDVAALPYNEAVLDHVRRWRDRGGRTALVTASDEALARAVATHLGLFDEVGGSDGEENLKGPAKAAWLEARYGAGGFAYVGDSPADCPIWEKAAHAVTVDADPRLRARVAALAPGAEHMVTRGGTVRPLLRALRPHQWLKNALVFLPVLAAHQFDALTIGRALLAFVSFSLIASSVYLLNDLLDLAADRAHPRKRERPFASGALPLSWGTVAAPGLLAAGFAIGLFLGFDFLLVMAGYYVVTTAYSFNLKRRLIVDICTLAVLYTVRIVAGGAATGIPLSVWLLAFSIFFFFSLAAMKRQAELVSSTAEGNETAYGRGYRVEDLPLVANMAVSSGYVSVLVFALYLNSDAVLELYSWPAALWGICLILLYWLSRMVMITHRGWMHDDPVVFAARDRISLACAFLIFVFAVGGVML